MSFVLIEIKVVTKTKFYLWSNADTDVHNIKHLSTLLHKYEIMLFSVTFLEHKKCIFTFKLKLV